MILVGKPMGVLAQICVPPTSVEKPTQTILPCPNVLLERIPNGQKLTALCVK